MIINFENIKIQKEIEGLVTSAVTSEDVRTLVSISQNDYDSLSAKSDTTLYIIQ